MSTFKPLSVNCAGCNTIYGLKPFRNCRKSAYRHQCKVTQQESPSTAGVAGSWAERLLAVAKSRPARQRAKQVSPELELEEGTEDDVEPVRKLPAEMRCFDTARIYIKAGDGGNGCVAFRREKFVAQGGPAGGDGGKGGNVWAVADSAVNSLIPFRNQVHWRAPNGISGQGSDCHGANASDLFIPVPLGTIIRKKDADESEPPLAELTEEGQKALLMVGGRGGRGNLSFKTSRNTAPTIAEKGEEGAEAWFDLELKIVADAGIIGIPNAGKSTLLSVITSARPKIANYPFTTLVPNLGVCAFDYTTTVFADIPGLLEGAHEGLGLGHEFLRHVQRCRVLVHIIDGTSPDPIGDFNAINLELELFNEELRDKRQVVAYNKMDVPESGDYWEFVREQLLESGIAEQDIFPVSAATGQGVLDLVRRVRSLLDEMGPPPPVLTSALNLTEVPKTANSAPISHYTIIPDDSSGDDSTPRVFYVQGEGIQKFAQMTSWNYYDSVKRFQRVLDVVGINGELRKLGVKEGDTVAIGEIEFEWKDDQSEYAVYDAWLKDMKSRGQGRLGTAHWPTSQPRRSKNPDVKGKKKAGDF